MLRPPSAPAFLRLTTTLLLAFALVPPALAQPASASLHLIPMPRELHPGASQPLTAGLHISCNSCPGEPEDTFAAQQLAQSLQARRISTAGAFTIQLGRSQLPAPQQLEGYTITPIPQGLKLEAASSAGLFYATQTLLQLIENDGPAATINLATIRDYPAMRYRGMQDDLSRGPISSLAFQKYLIRTLAAYKVNVYSPYFEETQQYTSNPLPAPPGGSISPADARELTAYAAQFHVTVIPDQEAFGHLHHNLLWEQYSALAETPHGAVLAPGQPGSLLYIQQIFTELAADYPGPFLHIGADETVDLGLGQTKPDVDARGLGPVYLDFLVKIDTALAPLHRKILFWGDIAQQVNTTSPDLLKSLPAAFKQNTIAVAWWYTPHPTRGFASYVTPFTDAGIETWVAPGVNNWSSVWPNSNDALNNIREFVAEGQRQHSTGVLNTVWYDDGEALANNNWYGLLFGAAAAWQPGQSSIPAFQDSYAQVFHGDRSGALNQAQIELMKCHDILRNQAHVGDGSDGLFWQDPWSKEGQPTAAKIRPYTHDLRLHAERALTLIAQARAANPAPPTTNPGAPHLASEMWDSSNPGAPSIAPGAPSIAPGAPSIAPGAPSIAPSAMGGSYNSPDQLPSNPTTLHNPDAIDALELGARRLDFIGLKFQLSDEIIQGYTRAQTAATSTNPAIHKTALHRALEHPRHQRPPPRPHRHLLPPPRPLPASLAPQQQALRPAPRPRALRRHHPALALPQRKVPQRPETIRRHQIPPPHHRPRPTPSLTQ